MKNALFYFSLLFVFILCLGNAYSQEKCSCVFESDENFQFNYTIQSTEGIDKIILTLNTINESCGYSHTHPVRYNDSIGQFEVFQSQPKNYYTRMTEEASTYAKVITLLDLKRVERLNFLNIKYDTDSLGFVPMSELPWIDKLKTPFLKSIFIGDLHWSNSADCLDIDFKNWGNYDFLVRMNNLESFRVSLGDNEYAITHTVAPSIISDIKPFKKLDEVLLPMYLNEELLNFPNLTSTASYFGEYYFAHHIPEMAHLPQSRHNWRSHFINYAQRTYFLNQNISTPDTLPISSIETYQSHVANKYYAQENLEAIIEKSKGSGRFTVLMDEWYSNEAYIKHNPEIAKDTLWDGELLNGKMIGLWKTFDLSEKVHYYVDYDHLGQIDFPENGRFNYYFGNGQLGITGKVKHGLKEGEWKFYELDGTLASVKHFEADRPRGLFIDYVNSFGAHHRIYEMRRFYVNDLEYYYSYERDTCNWPTIGFVHAEDDGSYLSQNEQILSIRENGKRLVEYTPVDPEYCKLAYEVFLKYVYPKTRKKNIPFIKCYCNSD